MQSICITRRSLPTILIILTLSLANLAAWSQSIESPRKIDFTQTLRGFGGDPIALDSTHPQSMTLGDAAVGALESQIDEDRAMTGVEKMKRDDLAHKVWHQHAVSLTIEELALIKDRIGKVYNPLVVGAAWRLLDPQPAGK